MSICVPTCGQLAHAVAQVVAQSRTAGWLSSPTPDSFPRVCLLCVDCAACAGDSPPCDIGSAALQSVCLVANHAHLMYIFVLKLWWHSLVDCVFTCMCRLGCLLQCMPTLCLHERMPSFPCPCSSSSPTLSQSRTACQMCCMHRCYRDTMTNTPVS